MQRGMLHLTNDQLHIITQFLPITVQNQFLISKLQAATAAAQPATEVLINEDELELILDNLPAPTPDQPPAVRDTQFTVQTFLAKLRGN